MAALAIALEHFGNSVAVTAVLVGIWGLVATAGQLAGVPGWREPCRTMPNAAVEMVALIQLAIAAGATLGGILFNAQGYQASFEMSAIVLILAAAVAALAGRASAQA